VSQKYNMLVLNMIWEFK